MNRKIVELLETGFQYQQQGDNDKAESFYLQVLKIDANNQFALNLMGVVCMRSHNYELAESFLRKALQQNSNDFETYSNLGLALKELKRLGEAQQMFEKSLMLNNKQPITLNNLGNIFASTNDHQKAVYCFDSALQLDNRYLDCINNLTLSLKELGNIDKAMKVIEYGIQLEPNRSDSHNNKGELYKALTDYESAKVAFERAIDIDGNIVAKINLSTILKLLGYERNGIELLQQVLEQEPNNSEAHNHLGVLYEQLGDFELAAKHFRLSLKHTSNHASSYYQLSKLKNQRLTNDEINNLKRLIADNAQLDLFKASFYLALACEYDKQQQYEKAIEHFILGKNIKAKHNPYNPDSSELLLNNCKKVFNEQHEQTLINDDLPKPIFIVGMPRSGTTLTEQILSSHSKIFGAGELSFINDIVKHAINLTQKPFPQCTSLLSAQQLSELRQIYLNKVLKRFAHHEYVIDKNPLNYNMLGFISRVFPEAKFIYCKREAMDNCISIFKLPFDDNQTYSHDLASLGHHYLQHTRLMSYWQTVFNERIFTVNYEYTVANLRSQSQQLINFIGLDFEEQMYDFHNNKRIVMTPSAEQVRQPIYNTSVGSWQKYGSALAPLINALN